MFDEPTFGGVLLSIGQHSLDVILGETTLVVGDGDLIHSRQVSDPKNAKNSNKSRDARLPFGSFRFPSRGPRRSRYRWRQRRR